MNKEFTSKNIKTEAVLPTVQKSGLSLPKKQPADLVSQLEQMLGSVVLIAWPKGVKGSPKKWKHLTRAHMTPEYLAKLDQGNIGLALGAVSGGLCAIDIDDDSLVEPFREANPALADTFQTHGSRGRVFWVRCKGTYPGTTKLKKPDGADAGEFRSNGAQSIVWGTHPDTGQPYQRVVNKPAVEIEASSIVWPECFEKPTLSFVEKDSQSDSGRNTFTEDVLQNQNCRESFAQKGFAEASEAIGDSLCASVCDATDGTIKNIEDVLRLCVPTKIHQNNDLLFKLARGVLNLERLEQHPYSLAQRLDVFNKWYSKSLPFLRPGQSRDAYLAEFMNAKKRATKPLGGNTIDEAWALARTEPLPLEALLFEQERNQRLVGFCFQLQRLNGSHPFFLSSRTCQRLLGLDTAHEAAKWLTALQEMGIIELSAKGNARQASRYRYVDTRSRLPKKD